MMWDDIDWLCGFTLTFAVFLQSYANEQSVMLKKYIIGIFNRVKIKIKRLLRGTPASFACQPSLGRGALTLCPPYVRPSVSEW